MRLEKRRRILAELKKQLDQPAWLSVSSEAQRHALRDLVERLERVVADGDAAVSRQRMPQADG